MDVESVQDSTGVSEENKSAASNLEEYLSSQQENLRSAIRHEQKKLSNQSAPIVSDKLSMESFQLVLDCYQNEVDRKIHLNIPNLDNSTDKLYITSNLLLSVKKEREQMKNLISNIEMEMEALDKENLEHDEFLGMLKEIAEKRQTVGELKENNLLDVKLDRVNALFKTFKYLANSVISDCFTDQEDNVKDILHDLCRHYFDGSDLYTDVPDNKNIPIIDFLLDANIIVRHPQESNLIRLFSTP